MSPLIDAKFALVDSVIDMARSVSVDDGGISIRDALDAWRYAVQHFNQYSHSLSHAKVYGEDPAEDTAPPIPHDPEFEPCSRM